MLQPIHKMQVTMLDSELLRRRSENRKYLMELDSDKLLLHHRFEAGLDTHYLEKETLHGGWEDPQCQLRGHFIGHWLSAAALEYAVTGDCELLAKAQAITNELEKCQKANGGEWCAPIPEKYMTLIAEGKTVWAPQYTIHKTFMGLLDLYEFTGNKQALDIAVNFSKWFYRWADTFSTEEFNRILDVETGGMLEVWCQLYAVTGDPIHRKLMDMYYRHSLFDGLLAGKDVLTNMHANTTIPEVLGAARAFEVTGEQVWLDIVKAYWDQAVTQRGHFCTGGQTCGEVWTAKMSFSSRLGEKNQEHCTVYNMMRLADFLFRNTGDVIYADYWERNLYNGIMAQAYYYTDRLQHGEDLYSPYPTSGLLTYFLPLRSGARKAWSSRTNHFFCCHGSLVQANAGHVNGIYYQDNDQIYICQYFDSDAAFTVNDSSVNLRQRINTFTGNKHMVGSMTGCQEINDYASSVTSNPQKILVGITVECNNSTNIAIKIRLPYWNKGDINLRVNDESIKPNIQDGFIIIERDWQNNDNIQFELVRGLTTEFLPDNPEQMAFLIGPIVLAGLSEGQMLYTDDINSVESILKPNNEREWSKWRNTFRTVGQPRDIDFIPLYQVGYEPYSVYFPIRKQ